MTRVEHIGLNLRRSRSQGR